MASQQESGARGTFWVLAAGALVGVGAALWYGLRRSRQPAAISADGGLEDNVIAALRRDTVLRGHAIDVAAIAPGIIELTGTVETEEEAHHAVDVVQAVSGVRTVLNRLDLLEFERRVRQRGRATAGAGTGGNNPRWYGQGVGMGRRRQSRATDPAQRDDHDDLLDEALRPNPEDIVAELNEERENEGNSRPRASELL